MMPRTERPERPVPERSDKELIDMLRAVARHRHMIAAMNGCDPETLKNFCRTWIYRMLRR